MNKSTKTWSITAVIAIFITTWFLWPWLSAIAVSALMAYIFYPLYLKLRRKKGHLASVVTLLASFLVVFVPLSIVLIAGISQILSFAEMSGRAGYWGQMPEFAHQTINAVNDMIDPLTGQRPSVSEQGIVDYLRNTVPGIARSSISLMVGMLASLPRLGIGLLIYSFLFIELLKHGPKLIKNIKKVSPFSKEITDKYFEQTGLMANAMVKGQMIIALLIAFISALLLIPLGYGSYFFVLLVVFTILNFIPLGSGIVFVPLAAYSMLTGNFWLGLVMIIVFYGAGNLDPILRTRFAPKAVSLSTAWTMISTFCGIAYFGILGVIYGPMIMILIINTWNFYIQSKAQNKNSRA